MAIFQATRCPHRDSGSDCRSWFPRRSHQRDEGLFPRRVIGHVDEVQNTASRSQRVRFDKRAQVGRVRAPLRRHRR